MDRAPPGQWGEWAVGGCIESSCDGGRAPSEPCGLDPSVRRQGGDTLVEPHDVARRGASDSFDELDREQRDEWTEEAALDIEIVDHLQFDAIDELPFVAVPAAPSTVRGDEAVEAGEALQPGSEDAARNEDAVRPGGKNTVPNQGVRPESEDTRYEDAVGDDDAKEPARAPDAFATLVGIMANVMLARGASADAASFLRALVGLERMEDRSPGDMVSAALISAKLAVATARGLARTQEFAAQVLAWRAILSGESDDFSACGSMALDEWAAAVVASTLGDGTQASGVRRELRRHGVAAFGLVLETAAA